MFGLLQRRSTPIACIHKAVENDQQFACVRTCQGVIGFGENLHHTRKASCDVRATPFRGVSPLCIR